MVATLRRLLAPRLQTTSWRAGIYRVLGSRFVWTVDISFLRWKHRLGQSSEAREGLAGRNKPRLER
jgi:hypothetical protein